MARYWPRDVADAVREARGAWFDYFTVQAVTASANVSSEARQWGRFGLILIAWDAGKDRQKEL